MGQFEIARDLSCLHDSDFLGIRLVNDEVRLDFVTVNRNRIQLRLLGLTRMRATDFLEGNIVLDGTVFDSSSLTPQLVRELLGTDDLQVISRVLENARKNKMFAVAINPSYGCSLIALCSRVLVTETNVTDTL